jgi:hypothetical protein
VQASTCVYRPDVASPHSLYRVLLVTPAFLPCGRVPSWRAASARLLRSIPMRCSYLFGTSFAGWPLWDQPAARLKFARRRRRITAAKAFRRTNPISRVVRHAGALRRPARRYRGPSYFWVRRGEVGDRKTSKPGAAPEDLRHSTSTDRPRSCARATPGAPSAAGHSGLLHCISSAAARAGGRASRSQSRGRHDGCDQ